MLNNYSFPYFFFGLHINMDTWTDTSSRVKLYFKLLIVIWIFENIRGTFKSDAINCTNYDTPDFAIKFKYILWGNWLTSLLVTVFSIAIMYKRWILVSISEISSERHIKRNKLFQIYWYPIKTSKAFHSSNRHLLLINSWVYTRFLIFKHNVRNYYVDWVVFRMGNLKLVYCST